MMGPKKKPASQTQAARKPSQPASSTQANQPEVAKRRPVPQNAEAHFQTVAQKASLPLGVRYSILKKSDAGLAEVKPDAVFHSGDRIRISVMGNQKGYLYVIARGSSGVWTPLFPHPDSSERQNEIVPGRKYQVPGGPGEYFLFDQQAGGEKVFILLSKTPVTDLDALILSLKPGSRPAALAPPEAQPTQLEARNRLNDGLVDHLRNEVQARDLVFTRTDTGPDEAEAAGAPEEKAVYVVNQNSAGKADSRVVVDLTLSHK